MKKILRMVLLLAISCAVVVSCKDDDEDTNYNVPTKDVVNNNSNNGNSDNGSSSNEDKSDESSSVVTESKWKFNVYVKNNREDYVYLSVDGEILKIDAGQIYNHIYSVSDKVSYATVILTNSNKNLILTEKVTKGAEFSYTVSAPKATLIISNDSEDNYYIYLDGTYVTTVSAKSEKRIYPTLGSHKLLAEQKDGYLFYATEVEKTVSLSESYEEDGKLYEWSFDGDDKNVVISN